MRVLIAGCGNVLLGDDGFGVEVVRRLAQRPLPPDVHVVEFGIRGVDLACALLDRYQRVILVDAAPRGGQPGSLYVIESAVENDLIAATETPPIDTHSLDPAQVLRLTTALGGRVDHVTLVGCEPLVIATVPGDTLALSDPVAATVDEAVTLIEALVASLAGDATRNGAATPFKRN